MTVNALQLPLLLRKLEGVTAHTTLGLTEFLKGEGKIPAASRGNEGCVIPVRLDTGRRMIKTFFAPCGERRVRARFLEGLRLHEALLPAFEAAPRHTLTTQFDINGVQVPVDGYLASFIEGKRYESALPQIPPEGRIRLAVQLLCAVRALNAAGIAHGDISPNNALIVPGKEAERPDLRLIDFDSFFHAKVPSVPFDKGCTFGTPGYQHREYEGGANKVVDCDWFAAGVMVWETIVADEDDELPLLGEGDSDAMVAKKRDAWPEGAVLLQRARQSARSSEAPSPDEWLRALGELARATPSTLGPAPSKAKWSVIVRAQGMPDHPILLRSSTNSFARLSLAWLHYKCSGNELCFYGNAPVPCRFLRGSISEDIGPGPINKNAISGDQLDVGQLSLFVVKES